MQHVVQEPDAGPYPYLLAESILARMCLRGLVPRWLCTVVDESFAVRGEEVEGPAVEGEGYLDFGFGGVAGDVGSAAGQGGGRCG